MSDNLDILRLSRVRGISQANIKNLYNACERNVSVVIEKLNYYKKNKNTRCDIVIPSEVDILHEIDKTQKCGGFFITLQDKCYPELLRDISDAPLCLICKGNKDILKNDLVSFSGTRKPTKDGILRAKSTAKSACDNGFSLVSGMALGIDSIAHKISKKNGTIAVLGHGLDGCYPNANLKLMQDIINNGGLIVTEYSIGSSINKLNFIKRNRIIAGLSRFLVIPQAGINSGTMSTARFARLYDRDIYVCKGESDDFSGNVHLLSIYNAKCIESKSKIGSILRSRLKTESVYSQGKLKLNEQNEYNYLSSPINIDVKADILSLLKHNIINISDLQRDVSELYCLFKFYSKQEIIDAVFDLTLVSA